MHVIHGENWLLSGFQNGVCLIATHDAVRRFFIVAILDNHCVFITILFLDEHRCAFRLDKGRSSPFIDADNDVTSDLALVLRAPATVFVVFGVEVDR